jgi:hypothetical protein
MHTPLRQRRAEMPEPLDPIVAGVATALKSLRTRAGLSEDRLADPDLVASDVLAGLTTVQQFVAQGGTPEQAIAQAVREAVQTLEPTDSIVADVILGLGLHEESLPDLYAGDLGKRRSALLKNWRQLHELRAAPWQGRIPSARALRLDVENQTLSALAVALTAGEGAPSGGNAPAFLSAPPVGIDPSTRAGLRREQVPLLSYEFRRIATKLREALIVREDEMGWARDLRKGPLTPASVSPTPVSTSYALQTIILLEGYLSADLIPVVKFLRQAAAPGGGYSAGAESPPRPERTATVLDTLHKVDGTAPFDAHIASIKKGIGPFERTRPYILSRILETSARSGRDSDLIRTVTSDLLAARRPFSGRRLWSQKAEDHLVAPVPSTVHTALAVRALGLAKDALPDDDELHTQVSEAIEEAGEWLAEGQYLDSTSEEIERLLGDQVEKVYERHFTAAWVLKALVSLGLPASHPAVDAAARRVWQDYHRETALWRWSNGDLPVWMTFDAVEALYLAAFAVPVPTSA